MKREVVYENRDRKILDALHRGFKRFARSDKKLGFLVKKGGYLNKRNLKKRLKLLRKGG